MYWCTQVVDPARVYLLRTAADPASLEKAVRLTLHSVEPMRAVYDLAPLPSHLKEAFGEESLRTLLLTLFAATALALACVGLYGTVAYFVTTKRREIGLRMALGARREQVWRRFMSQGMAATAFGILAGLLLAAWSARFVSGMLYNVGADDPTAFSAAILTMLSVALLASAIPAVRATHADPIQVLREE